MFTNILVATDGSAHAAKAVDMAAGLAAAHGARLTIITVLPASLSLDELNRMPQARRFPKAVRQEIERYQDMLAASGAGETLPGFVSVPAPGSAIAEIGEQILAEAEQAAKAAGAAEVRRVASGGHAAPAIAEQAAKEGADLIVMGTRGLSDIAGIVLGSTSHKVLHLATCPCLLVR